MNRRASPELQPSDLLLKPKIEWIQTNTDGLSTGTKMSSIRKNTYYELLSLRDYPGPVVTVECKHCRRSGELDRKKLVVSRLRSFGEDWRSVAAI